MILKPNNVTDDHYDSLKSATVLEKIYKNLGFNVERDKSNDIGRLYLNTRNIDNAETHDTLKTNLCLEENFQTGSEVIRKGLLDVYIDPAKEDVADDISEFILPDDETQNFDENIMEI